MTLDNRKASILVGQEVPVTTGEALSQNFDNQFRTVQRQDVGIQLEVKPQINAGGARSEEHTSELKSLMSNSYADFCLKKKKKTCKKQTEHSHGEKQTK